jgi:hypothetical protein
VLNARIIDLRFKQIVREETWPVDWVVLIDSLLKNNQNRERCIFEEMDFSRSAPVLAWKLGELALSR